MIFGLFWHWVWLSRGDEKSAEWMADRWPFSNRPGINGRTAIRIGIKLITAGIGFVIALVVFKILVGLLC
ncbi:MAG: hypothetical protein SWH61_00260 [Thermodesulfobacteriota bacterium]|nr:hypothetical protein [Thermodesulfobacteriota bacterium]